MILVFKIIFFIFSSSGPWPYKQILNLLFSFFKYSLKNDKIDLYLKKPTIPTVNIFGNFFTVIFELGKSVLFNKFSFKIIFFDGILYSLTKNLLKPGDVTDIKSTLLKRNFL